MDSIMTTDPLMTGALGEKKNCYRKMSVICSGHEMKTCPSQPLDGYSTDLGVQTPRILVIPYLKA